jgi:hypothetical protein
MQQATNFDSINFNPDTKELSIKYNGTVVFGPFNLSTTAVKLKVVRVDEQPKIFVETASPSSFSVENFELKINFLSNGHCANLLFDTLSSDCFSSIDTNELIGVKDQFHALWIGVDDIRNTFTSPKGLFLMERKVTSFEIVNDFLVLKYHSSITPD